MHSPAPIETNSWWEQELGDLGNQWELITIKESSEENCTKQPGDVTSETPPTSDDLKTTTTRSGKDQGDKHN